MIKRVIVAGGGTGGHLFPGIAVVEELRRRQPDVDVLFVGTERGIEARVLPAMGEKLELIEVLPLKGRSPAELVQGLSRLPGALAQAVSVVRRYQPDVVLGVGGYASGPVLAAAAALGVPTALLEQNAHVGLTNRLLAPVVGRAYVTFPETARRFRARGVRACGNPVRRAFVDAARRAAVDPDGFEARARRILVLGGSQGAQVLNQVVPAALARAAVGLEVVHQSGAAMRDEVRARYAEIGVEATVVPFLDDMASAYASAAIVIARAGATTVAEVSAVGRPAILVPYPHAADDHQRRNAEALQAAGAAICLPQDELTEERLARELVSLLDDHPRRRTMAEAARSRGRPEAAAAIVDDLCEWLGCPKGSEDAVGGSSESAGAGDGGEPGGKPAGGTSLRSKSYAPRLRSRSGPRRSNLPSYRRPVIVSVGE